MLKPVDRAALAQRGRQLEYFTIVWNSLEGLIAVLAGAIAGGISLVGFGVDSFIEVTSGAAAYWRMTVDRIKLNVSELKDSPCELSAPRSCSSPSTSHSRRSWT
jgi:hypothetical protein